MNVFLSYAIFIERIKGEVRIDRGSFMCSQNKVKSKWESVCYDVKSCESNQVWDTCS